jgi:CheY-like chemotaxis protein
LRLHNHQPSPSARWPESLFAVAITAAGDNQTPGRAFAAGFDRLLAKPLDLTALVSAVREGQDNHQAPVGQSARESFYSSC